MKNALVFAVALAGLSLAPTASAQTTTPLITVDAVSIAAGGTISVTGIPQGGSAQTTEQISFHTMSPAMDTATLEACHRQLLVALSKPGQYLVRGGPNFCTVVVSSP